MWIPIEKNGLQGSERRRGSLVGRSLEQEILQWGAGSSGAPLWGTGATSEPAVEVTAKGRDEPV
jgi:hypothetical protein